MNERTAENPTGRTPLFAVEVWKNDADGFVPIRKDGNGVFPFYDRASADKLAKDMEDEYPTIRVVSFYESERAGPALRPVS